MAIRPSFSTQSVERCYTKLEIVGPWLSPTTLYTGIPSLRSPDQAMSGGSIVSIRYSISEKPRRSGEIDVSLRSQRPCRHHPPRSSLVPPSLVSTAVHSHCQVRSFVNLQNFGSRCVIVIAPINKYIYWSLAHRRMHPMSRH